MASDKILVTGGAGFVGSALVDVLNDAGRDVHVLDNLSVGKRELAHVPDSHFHQIDIRDTEAVTALLERVAPSAIVHLAAIHFIPYCNAHPVEASSINMLGTRSVLQAAAATPSVRHVVFASTAAVYPILDGPIDETNAPGPIDIYGITKLLGENLMREFWLERRVTATVCRLFNAFGPNETNPHLIPEIESQLAAGARTLKLGNVKPKRDFIHTTDIATAILALLDRDDATYEIFNVGTGRAHSAEDVVGAFSAAIGEPIVIESEPARVRAQERMDLTANADRLRSRFGWAPRYDLESGIRELVGQPARVV